MNATTAVESGGDRRTLVLIAAAIIVAACLVYGRGLAAGFAGDDFMILHRLRGMTAPAGVLRFFRGDFFEYYRPLPFLTQAVDWWIARYDARAYHATNLLLHVLNTLLVLWIGRSLAPKTMAGPIAALLFALHASNHEAVMWISARFDLLATFFALAALVALLRARASGTLLAALLFFAALLSKESTVAMPIAAAAAAAYLWRGAAIDVARTAAPWLAALALYAVLRHVAGGVSAIGGAGRLPKAAMLGVCLVAIAFVTGDRWSSLRREVAARRALAGAIIAVILAAAAVAASSGIVHDLVADKLAVAGFVFFHLASPIVSLPGVPFYLSPGSTWYWLGGIVALAGAGAMLLAIWRPLVDDDRMWFLGAFLVATLLPISALTEGVRYLYLPSAACSLIAAILLTRVPSRARGAATVAVALFLAVSSAQIRMKVGDWVWAGRMNADGARLVDASLAPACGTGDVVFLTEPVGIRGVYTHFLYETFEPPRGCMPASFQILMRIVRIDTHVDVRWDGPSRIVLTVPNYQDNILLSRDLRNFDVAVHARTPITLATPAATVQAESSGNTERLTVTLAAGSAANARFFYYGDSAIHPLVRAQEPVLR